MRSKINKKAWKILTPDEQTAISLKLGYNKSTWQAGEVMEKAHYKFLEIESRAKHFLKIFTEHFELYEELLPYYIKVDNRFRTYIHMVVGNRLSIKEAVDFVEDPEFSIRSLRDEIITQEMEKLVKSKKVIYNNFALLLFEFDRWNNFRVLPPAIQEPSAFKRRNKNNEKKNIKNLLTLNDFQVQLILDRYKLPDNTNISKILYMPIPAKYKTTIGFGIIKVKADDATIAELSKFGFYLFYREDQANDFYHHILGYSFNRKEQKNNCREGQTFWPRFRQMIKNAINYNAISKRIASRKFLESAMRDMDQNYLNPKHEFDPNRRNRKRNKSNEVGMN